MKRYNLIVADPHAVVIIGLRAMFEGRGDVQVVGDTVNGQSAIELARDLRPDLVILEMHLPGVDGIDVTRQIVSEQPDVRVIGWSAELDSGQVRRFLDAGGMGLLLKNGILEDLYGAVDAVLGDEVYIDGALEFELNRPVSAPSRTGNSNGRRPLTAREREVLQLLADGNSTRTAAMKLFLSVKTIESHRKNIMDKLGLRSVAALTKYAVREGLTSLGV